MAGDPGLDYPWPEPPVPGELVEIAPGVLWLRMRLPFVLDHVNLWLLEGDDGWTAVDTGVDGEETRALWERVMARHLGGKPVTQLVVTHFHPDHAGVAGWLQERTAAAFWMSRTEWLMARMLLLEPEAEARADLAQYLRRLGFGPEVNWESIYQTGVFRDLSGPMPRVFQRLREGQILSIGGRTWRILTGGGHSPEMACLHCAELGILISGDQVLPRISPNIGVNSAEMAGNPLLRFLETLERFAALPADTLVLPSHNEPFRGLHRRLDALTLHHQERLALLLDACREPRTIAQLTTVMFRRPLTGFNVLLAAAETLAHINLLYHQGRIARSPETAEGFFFQTRPE